MRNLLKYIIMLVGKLQKTLRKISQWKSWKIGTGKVRAFALPTPKIRKNAVRHFNFSTPCQVQLPVKMRIILIWYFFTFCLLEISCDREGVLFALHSHLLFIIFCIILLIQKYYYLEIISIWISFAFEYYNHLPSIIISKSFSFA